MHLASARVRPSPLVLPQVHQLTVYQAVLNEGLATATERAYRRDLRYFSAWYQEVYGTAPEMPIAPAVAIRFLIDHTQGTDPKTAAVLVAQGYRRHAGPLRWRTVQRYLTALSVAHIACGHPSPDHDAQVRLLLRRIKRNPNNPPKRKTKAITADILRQLLGTCDQSLYGVRDRAILLTGSCSGGRRRSEIAAIRVQDLECIDKGYLLRIVRSKTDPYGDGFVVPLLGPSARAVKHWLRRAKITDGYLFRGIRNNGVLTDQIASRTIARIIKDRVAKAGLDAGQYGAHSLRMGFITESARQRVAIFDAMALSGHRTLEIAAGYYREAEVLQNPASRLIR